MRCLFDGIIISKAEVEQKLVDYKNLILDIIRVNRDTKIIHLDCLKGKKEDRGPRSSHSIFFEYFCCF